MFTGIVTDLGKIKSKTNSKLKIECSKDLVKKLEKGTSIAVSGVCLTVVKIEKEDFEADFMPETEKKTNIGYLKAGSLVNLELPATTNTFLAGHVVLGHIDTVGRLLRIKKNGNSHILEFSIPKNLSKYIVDKGSVALNGISLTIVKAGEKSFTVAIIPHTFKSTMIQTLKKGDYVNIEVDIMFKYLERLLKK